MGWWKLNCGTGGISDAKPSGAGDCSLLNAIPGRDTTEDHYGGDAPADAMCEAIHKIRQEFKDEWGREPYIEELDGVWKFCTSGYRKAGRVYEPGDEPPHSGKETTDETNP